MARKIYKQIKIVGLISFIPLMLLVWPLAGYFAGDFVVKEFKWPSWVILLSIVSGFLASLVEIIRIVKLCLKIEKEL